MSAKNLADARLSLAGMIVWLSSTAISSSLLVPSTMIARDDRGKLSRRRPMTFGVTGVRFF
jgi:hypothetical protein